MIVPADPSGRSQKIWFYFLDLRARYALIPLFLGLVLVESFFGKFLLWLSVAWIVVVIVMGRERPSDQEVDELLSLDLKPLMDSAMESLRPREEELQAAPLGLMGPLERNALDRSRSLTRPRTGKDGRRRSPLNRVVVLLPMESRLGIYSCHHDSLQRLTWQVSSEEHHYKDVVSVRLEKDVEAADRSDPKQSPASTSQILSLDLRNGRRLSVPAAIWQVRNGESEETTMTGLEKTLRAIQALLA